MSEYQRRSASSKTALIGDSQIPAALGQTITGALANIPFPFGIDPNTGEYGYKKAGADSVIPFSTGLDFTNALYHEVVMPAGGSTSYTLEVDSCSVMFANLSYGSYEGRSDILYINREFIVAYTPTYAPYCIRPQDESAIDVTYKPVWSSSNSMFFPRVSSYSGWTWRLLYY